MESRNENNSFYDVFQRHYSAEELKLLHDLAGVPLYSSYEGLMNALNNEIKKAAPIVIKKTRSKQNIKRSNYSITSN